MSRSTGAGRPLFAEPRLGLCLLGVRLLAPAVLSGCASERYTRPAGPAPRYESAPPAPSEDEAGEGTGASGDEAIESEIERALAADAGR